MVVGVLVQLASQNVDKIFDYSVPKELEDSMQVGIRVLVPFGRQTLEGFVLEIKDSSPLELKEVYSIVDYDIVLNKELLALGKEIQKDTLSTLISAYQVMLPKALKAKAGTTIRKKFHTFYQLEQRDYLGTSLPQKKILKLFQDRKMIPKEELTSISSSALSTLVEKKVLLPVSIEDYRLKYEVHQESKKVLTHLQQEVVTKVI